MDAPSNRDSQLLQHALRGEVRAAGTLLVEGYADEVYALCRSMVRDATAAEDLSQDVFSRAFTALPGFRGDASVRTWILKIARNRCIDHLRARGRAPLSEDAEPDTQPGPEPSVADLLTRRQDVQAGLAALTESERALVVLRFGHELDYPELADAFGLGKGAVRMRVSRAVAKMRDAIVGQAPPDLGAPAAAGAPAPAPAAPRRRRAAMPGRLGAPPRGAPPPVAVPASPPPPPSAFARPAPSSLRARLAQMAESL